MNKPVLSDLQQEFILTNFNTMGYEAMALAINTSIGRVMRFVYRMKLKPTPYTHFTQEEIEYILAHYRTHSYKEIGMHIGRTADSIKHKCQTKGWKRSASDIKYLRIKYSLPSAFKKGHLPENTLKDGDITTRNDKRGVPFKYIRLSLANWEYFHIYLWEKINGPIPQGMCLRCVDGNSLNCNPDNWELITQHENLIRNTGRDQLTDRYIINILTIKNKSIKEDIKQNPEIIDLKREEIKLRRTIYERQHKNPAENSGNERKAISIQKL